MGHYDLTVQDHPQGAGARREANHYVTGRDGGRDIDLRAHAAAGMRLHGRLLGFSPEGVATFAGDLAANLDAADATYARINAGIDRWIAANGIDAPAGAPYAPVWSRAGDGSAPLDLAAAGIRTIVWATGFSTDWSWVEAPGFGTEPHPGDHVRGVTSTPGLHVVGLPWLHTWGSGRFAGIARDAEHVAGAVAERAEAALRPAA
jgi:putative flavoprotein involved in K+ transport